MKNVNKNLSDHTGSHVGGINEDLGGVDPKADENLLRLTGISY